MRVIVTPNPRGPEYPPRETLVPESIEDLRQIMQ